MARWLARIALFAFTLLLLELGLHGAARISHRVAYVLASPWERDEPAVADARMGYVGNPLKMDHDRDGYRNADVPPKVDVVVFGDSQSYGVGVAREDAWPSVLAELSNLRVYNMALPGHGPANAALQLESALRMQPRHLLVGVYFGNDLFDGFALSRSNPDVARHVPPDLGRRAEELELQAPLTFGFGTLFQDEEKSQTQGVDGLSPQRLLSRHSALYGLLRSLRARLDTPAQSSAVLARDFGIASAALDDARLAWFSPFDSGNGWRTILTGRYRARVMDLGDPRLAAGLEIALASLAAVERVARAKDAQLLVVLVPTKEFVFGPRVADPERHVGLVDLLERETALRTALTEQLALAGIPVLDLTVVLRAQNENPYFEDVDGHPNPRGHAAIARAVLERLGNRHALQ